LRIWAPADSTINLGPEAASAASSSKKTPAVRESVKKLASTVKELEVTGTNKKGAKVVKKTTTSKSTIDTVLSYLFPFKL
jgi:hypothetical protein